MLRISEIELNGEVGTLRLEGRLVGLLVGEVKSVCEQNLSNGRRLRLDLADLSFADRAAIALLQDLRSRGVELTSCSPFLNEELKHTVVGGSLACANERGIGDEHFDESGRV